MKHRISLGILVIKSSILLCMSLCPEGMVLAEADRSDTVVDSADISDSDLLPEEVPFNLQNHLEALYETLRQAVTAGDVDGFKEVISEEAWARIEAVLEGSGRSIDSHLIRAMSPQYKDLASLEFVEIYEFDRFAGVLYVADSDLIGMDELPRVTYTFLKFIKENKTWKVEAFIHLGYLKFLEDGSTLTPFDFEEVPFWSAPSDQVIMNKDVLEVKQNESDLNDTLTERKEPDEEREAD